MEPKKDTLEEKAPKAGQKEDGVLAPDDLEKISGGTLNDPCEGGQFRNR